MRVHIEGTEMVECWVLDGSCRGHDEHYYSIRDAARVIAEREHDEELTRMAHTLYGHMTTEDFVRMLIDLNKPIDNY